MKNVSTNENEVDIISEPADELKSSIKSDKSVDKDTSVESTNVAMHTKTEKQKGNRTKQKKVVEPKTAVSNTDAKLVTTKVITGMYIDPTQGVLRLYKTSTAAQSFKVLSKPSYVWSHVSVNGRIRLTESSSGIGDPTKIIGWVNYIELEALSWKNKNCMNSQKITV